ncbi:hypothetical protein RRG08_043185 [Elysia crispata]|uniref:Uncharacterized protein n=1 Tax=Elysia crispata TaxID=231223 RepID=A0AAE1DHV1_9GAST|nr:hypothetical protein RRG08_043185 [Elysia crispata]
MTSLDWLGSSPGPAIVSPLFAFLSSAAPKVDGNIKPQSEDHNMQRGKIQSLTLSHIREAKYSPQAFRTCSSGSQSQY